MSSHNLLQDLETHNLGYIPTRRTSKVLHNSTPAQKVFTSSFYWKTIGRHHEKPKHDFGWPTDVAYLESGFLAVADYDRQRVELFDSVGQARVTIAQGLIQPFCLASDTEGQVLVTDQKNKCVVRFTITGKLQQNIGFGEFQEPSGVATFPDGYSVCTDTKRHVALLYNSDGVLVKEFGGQGTGFIQMYWPGYVATDSKGRILISDRNNSAVKIFDRNGKYLCRLGGNSKHGELLFPKGVCVDMRDNMFVAEWGQDRVKMYGPDGKFLRHMLTFPVTQMVNPYGIDSKGGNSIAISCRNPEPGIGVFKY